MDGSARHAIAQALQEARSAAVEKQQPAALSYEELQMYKDDGFLLLRGVVPQKLADVIREHVIFPGMKHEGALDACDPSTWGGAKLTLGQRLASAIGSETPYYGARVGFGRALERQHRGELSDEDFALIQEAWTLADRLAAQRLQAACDQLIGAGCYRFTTSEGVLKRSLHARYGLPAKDPRYSLECFRWPLIGWHIDGARHRHFLGSRVAVQGEQVKPAIAAVGLLAWNEILPYGGMTGVIAGSHKRNIQTIQSAEARGGLSNLNFLLWQSLFGGRACDPVTHSLDEKVLHAGDALLMHPYLTHSSAWNYRTSLRLGGHLQVEYREPMDSQALRGLAQRQPGEAAAASQGGQLPVNTQLLLEALDGELPRSGGGPGQKLAANAAVTS